MLQRGGYGVVQASSGEEALRLSRDAQHSVDLALLDVMMPGLNGIEVATRLRAAYPKLAIVLMSGYSIREIDRIVGAHPYRIIWKPFKTDSLFTYDPVNLHDAVTRHQNDGQFQVRGSQSSGDLDAIHDWHHDIDQARSMVC